MSEAADRGVDPFDVIDDVIDADGEIDPEAFKPVTELTSLQRDLLFMLPGVEHPTGSIIFAELEKYYPEDRNQSTVYTILDKLVDLGLVEKKRGVYDKRSNAYYLTEKGAKALVALYARKQKLLGQMREVHEFTPPGIGAADTDASVSTGAGDE